ncbi:MAG: type II secretion system protein GspD [Candidatus Rifleibacteriota bacterium]
MKRLIIEKKTGIFLVILVFSLCLNMLFAAEETKTLNKNTETILDDVLYSDPSQQPEIKAGVDGKLLTDDYHPDYLISTRYSKSNSGNVITWYLMYSRVDDIINTITDIFSEEIRSDKVKISANNVTNSIIIKSPKQNENLVNEILDTVKSLDFRSGQVLIEVLVVELSVTDEDLFDFELLNIVKEPFDIKNTLSAIGVDHGTISEQNPLSKSDRLKVFVTSPNRMKLFLNAYKDKEKANIISSPHIVAANHRKATFKIGNRVPIIDSIRPSDSGPIKSFDIKDVGIELSVTPHINRGNQIDMEVFQSINALQSYDATEGTARMSNREIETNAILSDGETLILGGFIEERNIKVKNRTPVLSRIPVIGKAFTRDQTNEEKVELLIFITPKILDTIEDSREALKQKVEKTSFKNKIQHLLKNMKIKRAELPESEEYILERGSGDWKYDFDLDYVDELVWDIPDKIKPEKLPLRRYGKMPFGYGSSKRLQAPYYNTELIPSDGFIMSRNFKVNNPEKFNKIGLKVASKNAATVYINGIMVEKDPLMKIIDGHDYDYWNRYRDDIPVDVLKEGDNNIVVFLACDKQTSEAYLDLEMTGIK